MLQLRYRQLSHLFARQLRPVMVATGSPDISSMRSPYFDGSNLIKDGELMEKEPIRLFHEWFEKARACKEILEANAMCLSTCTKTGIPSSRFVLLKGYGERGFVFYTNYNSRKGKEIAENPKVALVFYWEPLKRSVRIEGDAEKIPEGESDDYFKSRPFPSKIGALASPQSEPIASRESLDERERKLQQQYENSEVPRPNHWHPVGEDDTPDGKLLHSGKSGWLFQRLAP